MSHGKRRKETNCLNCGAELLGPYCHYCGQENLVPRESVWGLIQHFVYDITHFDGKFFSTTKYLLLRPGFLSRQYMQGRRASYLNPVRMYIFTSAFFFILFFALSESEQHNTGDVSSIPALKEERQQLADELSHTTDPNRKAELGRELARQDSLLSVLTDVGLIADSTDARRKLPPGARDQATFLDFSGTRKYSSVEAYDSVQAALPADKKAGWLNRYVSRKSIAVREKYKDNPEEFKQKFFEKFLHSLPQLMFISLPLVALFLRLLYLRRKQFFYVSHGILVINIYIAIFILIALTYFFNWLASLTSFSVFGWINTLIVWYIFIYVYLSMLNFYGQSKGKSFLKYVLLLFLSAILFGMLAVMFVLTTLVRI